jgi:hypothetical protein
MTENPWRSPRNSGRSWSRRTSQSLRRFPAWPPRQAHARRRSRRAGRPPSSGPAPDRAHGRGRYGLPAPAGSPDRTERRPADRRRGGGDLPSSLGPAEPLAGVPG